MQKPEMMLINTRLQWDWHGKLKCCGLVRCRNSVMSYTRLEGEHLMRPENCKQCELRLTSYWLKIQLILFNARVGAMSIMVNCVWDSEIGNYVNKWSLFPEARYKIDDYSNTRGPESQLWCQHLPLTGSIQKVHFARNGCSQCCLKRSKKACFSFDKITLVYLVKNRRIWRETVLAKTVSIDRPRPLTVG
jgi:hypothetical protein